MKAWELQGPGGVDEMNLVEKPVPSPGPGQVLVKLKAATINYRDLLTVKGGYGSRQKFPLVPLSDGAGVVESVGAGVTRFKPGDRVTGSFFEGWLGGEPSEEKMRSNLGGALDGVLVRVPGLARGGAGAHTGPFERRRGGIAALRRADGMERGDQARRHQTGTDRADAGHRRRVDLRAAVCENERRAGDRDLVERSQDREAESNSAPTSPSTTRPRRSGASWRGRRPATASTSSLKSAASARSMNRSVRPGSAAPSPSSACSPGGRNRSRACR